MNRREGKLKASSPNKISSIIQTTIKREIILYLSVQGAQWVSQDWGSRTGHRRPARQHQTGLGGCNGGPLGTGMHGGPKGACSGPSGTVHPRPQLWLSQLLYQGKLKVRRPGKTGCKCESWASKGRSASPGGRGELRRWQCAWGRRWTGHLIAQARATNVQRQRSFCPVLILWWHWTCLHEGFSSPGNGRGSLWGQWGGRGSQGRAAHLSLQQGLLPLTRGTDLWLGMLCSWVY